MTVFSCTNPRSLALLALVLATMVWSGCSHAYTRRFTLIERKVEIKVGGWNVTTGTEFYSLKDFGGELSDVGSSANWFDVGLRASAKRVKRLKMPDLELDIDTLRIRFVETGKTSIFEINQAFYSSVPPPGEVVKFFLFADSAGHPWIEIPETVDTILVTFNAKLTDRTRERNVTYQPVEMTLVRKESRSLAPWW